MHMLTKKRALVSLATLGVMAVAGVAFAYFTSTGTGEGEANVGTSKPLEIKGTNASTLYPGTSSVVSFTVSNPGEGHEQLGTIHLAGIVACIATGVAAQGKCPENQHEVTECEDVETGASNSELKDFYMKDVVANQDIAGKAIGTTVTEKGSLVMNDLASSQDACKEAKLTLSFTS